MADVYADKRDAMVRDQIAGRGITDKRVLDAMRKVPRHEFIPNELRERAYDDYPLPIGKSQTISQPYMVALMTELLRLEGREKVLEIGTGSGYQAAILAELAKEVYTVERIESLSQETKTLLDRLGYKNIKIRNADGTLGWDEFAPYDCIVVTAGAPGIPESLYNQLRESARMVIPIGPDALGQMLTLVEKKDGQALIKNICGCAFVPLLGKEGWNG